MMLCSVLIPTETLVLDNNRFTETIPPSIGSLTTLGKYLILRSDLSL